MKKLFTIFSIILLGAIACTRSEFESPKPDSQEESGMVKVTMTLDVPTNLMATTKGDMAEEPIIDNIRVAMFGTSGYPQAYTKAEPIESYANVNGDGKPETTFKFDVLLPVYEGKARIHIIANGDESIAFDGNDEDRVMKAMTTTGGNGGYWAFVEIPDGIVPKRGTNGTMIVENGNFVPTDETAQYFKGIELIRNFAEVSLSIETENLTNVTWALVNVPKEGTIVPISGFETRVDDKGEIIKEDDGTERQFAVFVSDYKDYKYDTSDGYMKLWDGTTLKKTYYGYMIDPSIETGLDTTVPTDNQLTTLANVPLFAYERLRPADGSTFDELKPTVLLIKGYYKAEGATNPDSKPSYYRIDLIDENIGDYLTLYRNYKYKIRIGKVGDRGDSSIEEAMKRNSGGNVSLSVETQSLTDLSDGVGRIFVQYIEKTFVTGDQTPTAQFWVRYIPDITVVDNEGNFTEDSYANDKVKITLDETGDAIVPDEGNFSYTDPKIDGIPTRVYTFKLAAQGDKVKSSTFTVTADNGKTGDENSSLHRKVTVKVMNILNMNVSLVPSSVDTGTKKKTVLKISIDGELQESMFPLVFNIEDVNHTLNPTGTDGNNNSISVPVKVGKSIKDGQTNSFYFIRTINIAEYEKALAAYKAGETTGIEFNTEFETVETTSATEVWVSCEYFKTNHAELTNKNS